MAGKTTTRGRQLSADRLALRDEIAALLRDASNGLTTTEIVRALGPRQVVFKHHKECKDCGHQHLCVHDAWYGPRHLRNSSVTPLLRSLERLGQVTCFRDPNRTNAPMLWAWREWVV